MPSASVGPPSARVLAVQRVPERGIERGLRSDDLDRRLDSARRHRVAGDQAAAADRDHQHVEIGDLLQHFERDRALAGDHARIVVGVNPGETALTCDRLGADLRVGDALAVEHDFGAMRLRRLDLHEWRRHRHHDGGRNPQARGMIGNGLGVVAGRHGDHAAGALDVPERGELVERAALLERVGDLKVLVFDEHLGAGQRGELRRRQHRRAQHLAGDGAARGLDVGDRHAHASPPACSGTAGTTAIPANRPCLLPKDSLLSICRRIRRKDTWP